MGGRLQRRAQDVFVGKVLRGRIMEKRMKTFFFCEDRLGEMGLLILEKVLGRP